MSCRVTRRRLFDYEQGTLSAARRRAVEDHLASCGACAAELRAETAALDALATLRDDPPPGVDVSRRVMAAIAESPTPAEERVRPDQIAWAATVAAVLSGLVVGRLLAAATELVGPTNDGQSLASATFTVLAAFVEPALALGRLLGRLGLLALDAALPVLAAGLVTAAVLTVATSTAIVARDLLVPLPASNRSQELDR